MAEKRRVRPRPGDVVRIKALDGTAADAQYTHKHASHGALLRVLGPTPPELVPAGDGSAVEIAARATQFLTFFPLGAACARGIATVLGPAPVPDAERAFPLFRSPIRGREGVTAWWLWDGEREWGPVPLGPAERRLPIRAIVNDTLLVERALAGWTAEQSA